MNIPLDCTWIPTRITEEGFIVRKRDDAVSQRKKNGLPVLEMYEEQLVRYEDVGKFNWGVWEDLEDGKDRFEF